MRSATRGRRSFFGRVKRGGTRGGGGDKITQARTTHLRRTGWLGLWKRGKESISENAPGQELLESAPYAVLTYDSLTVSSTLELTSVSMRYSEGGGVNTSLSRLVHCTHV